jgi:hypothetical protein
MTRQVSAALTLGYHDLSVPLDLMCADVSDVHAASKPTIEVNIFSDSYIYRLL